MNSVETTAVQLQKMDLCFLCVLDKVDNRKKGSLSGYLFSFTFGGTSLAYLLAVIYHSINNQYEKSGVGSLPGCNRWCR